MDGLKSAAFNTRPATIDRVIIGLLDLAKVENKKYVFIIGMNYNVMPQSPAAIQLLRMRKSIPKKQRVTLSPSARTLAQDERFVLLGVTRPTDELYQLVENAAQQRRPNSVLLYEFLPEDPEGSKLYL